MGSGMPTEVTDPSILAQLNGPPQEVTDPDLLSKLNASDEPSETAGRVAGLSSRGLGTGIAGLAGSVASALPPGQVVNAIDAFRHQKPAEGPYKPQLSDFIHPDKWQQAAEYFADKAGMPSPQTDLERIGYRAVQALPSAVVAPEAPIAGALSAAAGAGASEYARQQGASPVVQTAIGLAAGSLPVAGRALAAGARGLVRGGAQGQAEMQARLANAAASDTPLSAGQAGGSPTVQYLEGAQRALPGSGPLKELPGEQAKTLESHVGNIIDNLSQGAPVSPTSAGSGIVSGIGNARTPGTAFGNMRAAEKAAYAKVDTLVPADYPVDLSSTLAKLDSIATPTPGATNTTAALIPKKITELRDNIRADMAANGSATPELPYAAAAALKTKLGNSIDWGFSPADPVANGSLKQIHASLKNDIGASASNASPQAAQAVTDANRLYATNQVSRDALTPIIDRAGGPEAVYGAATNGTKQGASKIGQIMTAINPDQQNIVRATVLDKLGRASGAQGAPFSPSTFLTNWTKLDPDAKDAMFGASGSPASLRDGLDKLTNTMNAIRSGTKLQNWSGTGEKIGHSAGLLAAWEGIKQLMAGNPHVLFGTAAGVAVNNILARTLTNPKTVNWFAQSTRLPVSALPNAVNQLSQMQDPDAQALASYLQQQPSSADRTQRASGGKVDVDVLVNRLIQKWKAAKVQTDKSTAPLLKMHDSAIAKALDIAQQSI